MTDVLLNCKWYVAILGTIKLCLYANWIVWNRTVYHLNV